MTRKLRRHPDRLTNPDDHEVPGAIACTMIVAPLDRLREEMDRKWGMDRLPGLYPPEPGPHVPADKRDAYRAVPERYGRAVEELHRALDRNDVEAVRTWTGRAHQMLGIMDRECEAAGIVRPEPDTLETDVEGRRVIVVGDTCDAAEVERRNPGAVVVTLAEAAFAVERLHARTVEGVRAHPLVAAALETFPGSDVSVGRKSGASLDDPIPF